MNKDIVLETQSELTRPAVDLAEEIYNHLIKAQSVLDLVSNSIEEKNADNKLDLASELNSTVAVYDELEHALGDSESVLKALKEDEKVDERTRRFPVAAKIQSQILLPYGSFSLRHGNPLCCDKGSLCFQTRF